MPSIFLVTKNGEFLGFEEFGVGLLTRIYKTNSRETPAPSQFSPEIPIGQVQNRAPGKLKARGFLSYHYIIDSSTPQSARAEIISEYREARRILCRL